MGARDKQKFERFAQGVADGLTVRKAAVAAGYSHRSSASYAMAALDDFRARVSELKEERQWGGSTDLRPVINAYARHAQVGLGLGSAAGVRAANEAMANVARLKQLLARAGEKDAADEWAAQNGPRS